MLVKELIGKTISNIYQVVAYEQYGLDTATCFIELDKHLMIDLPYSFSEAVWIKALDKNAESIFKDLSDIPVYHVNKDRKSIKEIADKYAAKEPGIFTKLKWLFTGRPAVMPVYMAEYQPYKIEYRENKLKYLQNQVIRDVLIWNDDEKVCLELANGYYISETGVAHNGTGRAGINLYASLQDIISLRGNDFQRLSDSL